MCHAESMQRAANQFGLCRRGPDNMTRPITVAEAGAIKNNHAIILGGLINQTAALEILDHAAVAVQHYQRRARPTFDIVQPDAVYLQELTSGRIVVLSILG